MKKNPWNNLLHLTLNVEGEEEVCISCLDHLMWI